MKKPTRCAGYPTDFGCPNPPGTPWTPYWCAECDEKRRAAITDTLETLSASYEEKHP